MEYDQWYESGLKFVEKIQKSIIPIFKQNNETNKPTFVGSSIYCRSNNLFYLVSVAHVFKEDHPNKLLFPYTSEIIKEIPSNTYLYPNNDKDDFCIIPLYEELSGWIPINSLSFGEF